jgi:hypothetical protein
MTNAKLQERLAKLKAHAESAAKIGSEAEAQAFTMKLNEMLLANNMEMSDIEWEAEVKEKAVMQSFWASQCTSIPKWARKNHFESWATDLAGIVAQFSGSRIMVSTRGNSIIGIYFCGLEANVATAIETMKYLYPAAVMIAQRAYDKAYNELYLAKLDTRAVKGYRSSFLVGFTSRLRERFEEHAEAMRSKFAGCALMRISDALVVADKYIEESGSTVSKVKMKRMDVSNRAGFVAGQKRANDMNIGGAVLPS